MADKSQNHQGLLTVLRYKKLRTKAAMKDKNNPRLVRLKAQGKGTVLVYKTKVVTKIKTKVNWSKVHRTLYWKYWNNRNKHSSQSKTRCCLDIIWKTLTLCLNECSYKEKKTNVKKVVRQGYKKIVWIHRIDLSSKFKLVSKSNSKVQTSTTLNSRNRQFTQMLTIYEHLEQITSKEINLMQQRHLTNLIKVVLEFTNKTQFLQPNQTKKKRFKL